MSLPDRVKDQTPKNGSKPSSAFEKYKAMQGQVAVSRGSLTWADCPAEELTAMVASVTEDGAAILLAKTSDGGALVVRVIADRESIPFYAPDTATLNHLLREVTGT